MKILVTGGAGYIGSITNQMLVNSGHETVVFDNLSRGHKEAVGSSPLFVGDLTNREDINAVFEKNSFDAVVHFAALTLAGESMEKPYDYYVNNVTGGLNLLEAMRNHKCQNIVFSSTCAVYGTPVSLPVSETAQIHPESVYASSKRMVEEVIGWFEKLYGMHAVQLRYFNAAGASSDGALGEKHNPETHIIPIAMEAAAGKRKVFEVYGNDYETKDGTCIRDYIHVEDLADAHIKALEYLKSAGQSVALNLGVGHGYSNKEVIDAVCEVTGKQIPVVYKERRPGDPAQIYADNTKAQKVLGWRPHQPELKDIVASAWKWYTKSVVNKN